MIGNVIFTGNHTRDSSVVVLPIFFQVNLAINAEKSERRDLRKRWEALNCQTFCILWHWKMTLKEWHNENYEDIWGWRMDEDLDADVVHIFCRSCCWAWRVAPVSSDFMEGLCETAECRSTSRNRTILPSVYEDPPEFEDVWICLIKVSEIVRWDAEMIIVHGVICPLLLGLWQISMILKADRSKLHQNPSKSHPEYLIESRPCVACVACVACVRMGHDGVQDLDEYGLGRQGLLQYHCSFQSLYPDLPGGGDSVHAQLSAGLLCLLHHPVGGLCFIGMFADPWSEHELSGLRGFCPSVNCGHDGLSISNIEWVHAESVFNMFDLLFISTNYSNLKRFSWHRQDFGGATNGGAFLAHGGCWSHFWSQGTSFSMTLGWRKPLAPPSS